MIEIAPELIGYLVIALFCSILSFMLVAEHGL